MLGLATLDELSYVLDSSNDLPVDFCFSGEVRRCAETYKKRPGFFQPYQNSSHFVGGLVAPVLYPLGFGALGVMSGLIAAMAPAICVGSLMVAFGAAAFGAYEVGENALEVAALSLYVTGYALVLATTSFLLSILSIPSSLVTLGTRTLSTVGSKFIECISDERDVQTSHSL